jgi:hypothetical protein
VARCYSQRGRRPNGDGAIQIHAFEDQGEYGTEGISDATPTMLYLRHQTGCMM